MAGTGARLRPHAAPVGRPTTAGSRSEGLGILTPRGTESALRFSDEELGGMPPLSPSLRLFASPSGFHHPGDPKPRALPPGLVLAPSALPPPPAPSEGALDPAVTSRSLRGTSEPQFWLATCPEPADQAIVFLSQACFALDPVWRG